MREGLEYNNVWIRQEEEGPVGREGITSSLSVCPREKVVDRRHSRLALELLLVFPKFDVSVRDRPAR